MSTARAAHSVNSLVGRAILSRATGNKLGTVHDLIVDPINGSLLGIAALTDDGGLWAIAQSEIFSFGTDTVMVNADNSLSDGQSSGLSYAPLAKHTLIGAQVITESGKILGHVADLFILGAMPPVVLYEIRESLLDKLLGRSLFLSASAGKALSFDAKRIIVPDDLAGGAAESLEALTSRLNESWLDDRTMVRGPGGALRPFEEGTLEVTEKAEEAVVSKQPRVVEEVSLNKSVGERQEVVRETLHGTDVSVERLNPAHDRGPKNSS